MSDCSGYTSIEEEIRALERHIAYHGARADIETFCASRAVSAKPRLYWYDTATAESEEANEFVTVAVRYLELRGLLERNPENPAQVRPLNLPEEVTPCLETK